MSTDEERQQLRARARALAQAGDLEGLQQALGASPKQRVADLTALTRAAQDRNLAEVTALLAAAAAYLTPIQR